MQNVVEFCFVKYGYHNLAAVKLSVAPRAEVGTGKVALGKE